jgi:hypothetical protein
LTGVNPFPARQRAGLLVLAALSDAQAYFATCDTDLLTVFLPSADDAGRACSVPPIRPGAAGSTRPEGITLIRKLVVAGAAFAAGLAVIFGAAAGSANAAGAHARPQLRFAAASVSTDAATHTMTTQVSLDPDSGDAGNYWGLDTYTQTVTIRRGAQVAAADCGAGAARCFAYTFTMADKGTTQTIAGQESPGNPAFTAGRLLDVAENAQFSGGTTDGTFFSSYKRYYTQYVPTVMNENGVPATGNYTVGNWVELGQPGAHFADVSLGADAGWSYVASEGTDGQCPRYSGEWVDSQASDWGLDYHGNILAPDAADCATSLG